MTFKDVNCDWNWTFKVLTTAQERLNPSPNIRSVRKLDDKEGSNSRLFAVLLS
jgi:hypothetical protein